MRDNPGNELSDELVEELAEEFMERRRRGEHPSISEYELKYPQLSEEIRELFPMVRAMEALKQSRDRAVNASFPAGSPRIKQLGEFRIIRELGRGGMGVVFEAMQESLNRPIAVKVLSQHPFFNADALKRFQREAHIAARLQHPNIVPIYSIGETQDCHFIAMQRIRGIGLDRLIARLAGAQKGDYISVPPAIVNDGHLLRHLVAQQLESQRRPESQEKRMDSLPRNTSTDSKGRSYTNLSDQCLPPAGKPYDFGIKYYHEVAGMMIQAADALDYAHSQNVLHRDVKSANLILDVNGHVWVTDFGIAKALESEDITTAGMLVGTLRFMAPEQFDGHADVRSEIYSLGLTLYELLCLRPAFGGKSQSELMRRILYETLPAPRRINPLIPKSLQSVILKATARNPVLRYQSAAAMRHDLQRFSDGDLISTHPVKIHPKTEATPKGKPIAAFLLIAAVIAGIIYVLLPHPENEKLKPAVLRSDTVDSVTDLSEKPVADSKEKNQNKAIKTSIPVDDTSERTAESPELLPIKNIQPLAELPEKEIQIPLPLPSEPPLRVPPRDIKPYKEPPPQEEHFPQRPPPGLQPGPQRGYPRQPPMRPGKHR